MSNELTEATQELHDQFVQLTPEYTTRAISETEKPYVVQLINSSHYCTGLILKKQTYLKMAFMSLPFGKFVKEMRDRNIDLDFLTYLATLKTLNIADSRIAGLE
jgi:hypothetical protein